jgi:hypothetical protein
LAVPGLPNVDRAADWGTWTEIVDALNGAGLR